MANGDVASDYRGDGLEDASDSRGISEAQLVTNDKKPTFSNIVKASTCPKKDQAVIFPAFDSLQVKDYVIATADVVNPNDIRFVSRMSNNRICLYFSSKDIANQFIENHGGVNIKNVFIPARKLMLPAKRIIISNIPPFIPDHVVEDQLHSLKIKILSPVSHIGAGIGLDKLRHVLSFRRQVFVSADSEFPSSLQVNFEDEVFRIFLSDEKIRCFRCKEFGHIASKCTNIVTAPEVTVEDLPPVTNTKRAHSTTESLPTAIDTDNGDTEMLSPETPVNVLKPNRAIIHASNSATEEKTTDEKQFHFVHDTETCKEPKPRHTRKKIRVNPPPTDPITDRYEDIEKRWESSNNSFLLDYCTFCDFLNSVKGSDKPLDVALRYTDNVEGLVLQINSVRRDFTQRHLKERCKRLISALQKAHSKTTDLSPPLSSTSESSVDKYSSVESLSSQTSFY